MTSNTTKRWGIEDGWQVDTTNKKNVLSYEILEQRKNKVWLLCLKARKMQETLTECQTMVDNVLVDEEYIQVMTCIEEELEFIRATFEDKIEEAARGPYLPLSEWKPFLLLPNHPDNNWKRVAMMLGTLSNEMTQVMSDEKVELVQRLLEQSTEQLDQLAEEYREDINI